MCDSHIEAVAFPKCLLLHYRSSCGPHRPLRLLTAVAYHDCVMSEFDEISWPDLTSDDYAEIDKICVGDSEVEKGASASGSLAGLELKTNSTAKYAIPDNPGSPYSLFRKRGYLSVTDIISPAWYIFKLIHNYVWHEINI